ncbi:MAG: HAMP domain-containing histidine kinase [Lachnospiraceae bacterium]|nr:HAMP domain-containing histidine kinase [Lachnospiraceae bacterium]
MSNKRILSGISGCIVGFLAGNFVITEGRIIRNFLFPEASALAGTIIEIIIGILAVGVFLLTVRWFWASKKRSLTSYYLKAVLVSSAGVILLLYLIMWPASRVLTMEWMKHFFETNPGMLIQYHLSYLLFAFLIAAFAFIFSCITKKKIAYIGLLVREVKKMESSGFGGQIPVYGEDELADLCISINHMSEELFKREEYEKQLEQRKKELITNVSHDLRGPLTSIIGYVELLKQSQAEGPERLAYMGVVERRLQGLHHLINELFTLTKLESQDIRLKFERIDGAALFCHMAEEYSILYEGLGLQVEKNLTVEEAWMEGDTETLARAMQNLFDNTGKYTKKGGCVEIFSQVQIQEGERKFRISISNDLEEGEMLDIERLFDRSYRGDVSRSDRESSGLGLSIAKRIAELHGGSLGAKREENVICFEMVFPLGSRGNLLEQSIHKRKVHV